MRRRQLLVFLAAVVAFSALIFPAQATQPDADGNHKVYVCHRTGSVTNPYVVIHVDVAARDAHEGHGDDVFSDERITKLECEDGGGGGVG